MYKYWGAIDQADRWQVYVNSEEMETSPLPFLFQDSNKILVADRKWKWGDESADTYLTAMSVISYEYARDMGTEAAEEFAIPMGISIARNWLAWMPVCHQRNALMLNWSIESDRLREVVTTLNGNRVYENYERYSEEEVQKWYNQRHLLG